MVGSNPSADAPLGTGLCDPVSERLRTQARRQRRRPRCGSLLAGSCARPAEARRAAAGIDVRPVGERATRRGALDARCPRARFQKRGLRCRGSRIDWERPFACTIGPFSSVPAPRRFDDAALCSQCKVAAAEALAAERERRARFALRHPRKADKRSRSGTRPRGASSGCDAPSGRRRPAPDTRAREPPPSESSWFPQFDPHPPPDATRWQTPRIRVSSAV